MLRSFRARLWLLHFNVKVAAMTALEIEVDGEDVFDASLAVLADQLRYRKFSPQTDFVHFTTAQTRRVEDVLPLSGVQDFRVKPTFTKAGSLPILMETVNAPSGIPEGARLSLVA